jgi:hypothetical protein
MKLDLYFTPYVKINSKQMKVLNVRPKTNKHRRKYRGKPKLGNDFLNIIPKAQATNAK